VYVSITGAGKARVIQFREDTRIPGTTKKKTKVIKTLGNYERMLAEDPDIIQKLKQEAAAITKAKKESRTPITLQLQVADITSPEDVATHLACRHLSGFFLSYMAEFWDNEWRVRIVSTCHSLFASRKAKERTPWPASLVRSFLRSYNQDDYTERTAICREVFGAFQGRLPRRIPAYGMPTLQEAGQTT